MSTQSELGQCYHCEQEGVSRAGVIDYSARLVCRDHYERDRAVDDQPDHDYLAWPKIDIITANGRHRMGVNEDNKAQSQTLEVPKNV